MPLLTATVRRYVAAVLGGRPRRATIHSQEVVEPMHARTSRLSPADRPHHGRKGTMESELSDNRIHSLWTSGFLSGCRDIAARS